MKHFSSVLSLAALAVAASGAQAQITSQADAFSAGRAFAQPGSAGAGGAVNATTGAANLPNFTTNAPESGNYGGGKGAVGAAGTAKQADCLTSTATTALAQQECDAVNFLSKNPTTRPKFNIDKTNDPLITGSTSIIKNPGTTPGSGAQQCRVIDVTTPGTFKTERCTEAYTDETITCQKIATPTVTWKSVCAVSVTGSNVNGMTSGGTVSCGIAEPGMTVNVGTIASQCHGGGCNSDYYDFNMPVVIGTPSSYCQYLSVNYKGQAWNMVCGSYDGKNTIAFSGPGSGAYVGDPNAAYYPPGMADYCTGPLTVTTQSQGHGNWITNVTCDYPTVSPKLTFTGGWKPEPTITQSWSDLCAPFEARAL